MSSFIQPFLSLFQPRPTTNELDVGSIVFDPNGFMTTNHVLFLFSCWASMPPLDSSKPVDILSQFKVRTITHNKRPNSPENEFLVIETVDQSNKTYLFILQRTVSRPGVAMGPDDDPGPPYRTRPIEKIRKFLAALAASITVPHESHLPSTDSEEGSSSSSSSSSPSTTFDSLSIGDSLDKSDDFPVLDRFLGQNYVHSAQWHGQTIRYFKPDHLTLFELVLLAHVVHEMHPTSSILGEQCYFYVRLVYTALENYFCTASKSADESKDLVCNIDSHFSIEYGHWKGPIVNKIEEEAVSKIITAYEIAYREQVVKITKAANVHRDWEKLERIGNILKEV